VQGCSVKVVKLTQLLNLQIGFKALSMFFTDIKDINRVNCCNSFRANLICTTEKWFCHQAERSCFLNGLVSLGVEA
jgi:hypothetical protein